MLQGVSTVGRLSRSWLRSLDQPANPSRAHPRGDAEVERLATCHTDRIMTFEEGLERLKERHEALTQSVELMVAETGSATSVSARSWKASLGSYTWPRSKNKGTRYRIASTNKEPGRVSIISTSGQRPCRYSHR